MAPAQLRYYRDVTMTLFSYVFGMALSIALGAAIGGAYVRDHYYGVWTRNVVIVLSTIVVVFGIIFGWAIATWLNWALNSASVRAP